MYDCEELKDRLYDLGYEVEENQEELLLAAMKRAEQSIMNECNTECVPYELRFVALDLAAAEYLIAANEGKECEERLKSISEGDLSLTFNEESTTGAVIDELFRRGKEEMLSFRRVRW